MTTGAGAGGPRQRIHLLPTVGAALSAALVAALVGLAAVGGLDPAVAVGLPDPGTLTRVALPAVQAARDVVAAGTVGVLVVAATCLPRRGRDRLGAGQRRLLGVAQALATSWATGDVLLVLLVYSDVVGEPVGATGSASGALFFATNLELGTYLTWGTVLAAAVAVACALARRVGGAGVAAALAVVALWPIALTGHAAGTLDHGTAVTLQMVHLVGVGVWLGGLGGLLVVRSLPGIDLRAALHHYGRLATGSLLAVSASGALGAALRVREAQGLLSAYGALLLAKAVLLLAVVAVAHRVRLRVAAGGAAPGGLVRLMVTEALALSTALGLGVALARTAPPPPPGSARPLTTAESMTGYALPAPLDGAAWFTGWSLDMFFGPLAVVAMVAYVLAVRRLRRRGDAWSPVRTAAWLLGCVLFLWATNGAPGTYGRFMFSMHMVQHMTVATGVPVFLALGAPVTLALRTLRRRADGTLGPREWLLRVVHSWPAYVLGHPLVAAALFVTGIVGFYYSSAFATSLESHTGHLLMIGHFLVSGYLFAQVVVGVDPGVRRPPYPLRALLLMVTFGFHALFSVALMASTTVLAEDWFRALQPPWVDSLEKDQYLGASLGWGLGEYPLAVMAVALLVSWFQADQREQRQHDRSEARTQDAELTAYNARLAGGGTTIRGGARSVGGAEHDEGGAS